METLPQLLAPPCGTGEERSQSEEIEVTAARRLCGKLLMIRPARNTAALRQTTVNSSIPISLDYFRDLA